MVITGGTISPSLILKTLNGDDSDELKPKLLKYKFKPGARNWGGP